MKTAILGRDPVALMRLVEVDDILDAMDAVPGELMVEPKFNGWLVQIVNGRIWSRGGKELTRKLPAIADQVKGFRGDHLLGELVYWDEVGMMDEPAVTHVAGTKDPEEAARKLKEAPGNFQIALFDVIALDGRDISKESTWRRRERLDRMGIPETWDLALSPVYRLKEWRDVYQQNVCLGGDGVVFKNPDAPYTWRPLGEREARPSGTWLKLKPSSTDDFVVTGTHYGPKGRLIVELSQYHEGKLVFVSDMSNIARDLEPVLEKRAKREPFVVEVEFQSRFPDPPGALQHPRLVRVREDKGPQQTELPPRYAP